MSPPVVADGVVYVGSLDHELYAFAVGCGSGGAACAPLWTGTTGDLIWSSPAVADGVVYVTSGDGKLYAFAVGCGSNGAECSPLWTAIVASPSADTGSVIPASPAVVDGVVYVGSDDATLYAFAAGCATGGGTCAPLWRGIAGGGVTSPPAVAEGVVYITDRDSLYAFEVGCARGEAECSPLWTVALGGIVPYPPAVADDVVFVTRAVALTALPVGCRHGRPCAPLWTGRTASQISSSAVAEGVAYVTDPWRLYAFEVGAPAELPFAQPLWTGAVDVDYGSFTSPVVANGVVYVGHFVGLFAFAVGCGSSGADCSPIWTASFDESISSSPVIADGAVYVGGDSGNLYALTLEP